MNRERDLILKEEVHRIVGCAMELLNVLGHGFLEKTYENALVVELGLKKTSSWKVRKRGGAEFAERKRKWHCDG